MESRQLAQGPLAEQNSLERHRAVETWLKKWTSPQRTRVRSDIPSADWRR